MTNTLTLTSTPVQISNGTKEVYLTVNKGSKPRYAIGATSPDKSAYHELNTYEMNIGLGFSVWMWSGTNQVTEVTYSESGND